METTRALHIFSNALMRDGVPMAVLFEGPKGKDQGHSPYNLYKPYCRESLASEQIICSLIKVNHFAARLYHALTDIDSA